MLSNLPSGRRQKTGFKKRILNPVSAQRGSKSSLGGLALQAYVVVYSIRLLQFLLRNSMFWITITMTAAFPSFAADARQRTETKVPFCAEMPTATYSYLRTIVVAATGNMTVALYFLIRSYLDITELDLIIQKIYRRS
jgi:hypothetical protein